MTDLSKQFKQFPDFINPVFTLEAELSGVFPGDTIFNDGDLFGVPLALYKDDLLIGALYSTVPGPGFCDDVPQIHAGASYFFRRNPVGQWLESQDVFVYPFAWNQISGTVLAAGKDCDGNVWLFIPATGTPLDVSGIYDPNTGQVPNKDKSGKITVWKRSQNGKWNFTQFISNPDGPVVGAGNEFGLNLDYTGGDDMIVGGGIISKAYIYHRGCDNHWRLAQNIFSGPIKGNLIVAIGGDYAFVQVPIDFSQQPIQANQQVNVYLKVCCTRWCFLQTLQGFDLGPVPFSDLFGSPMHIDIERGNAIIAAPGDGDPNDPNLLFSGAAYFLKLQGGLWNIIQKVRPDVPTLFGLFGFGNAINDNLAVIGNPGQTVGSNATQGVVQVYQFDGIQWNEINVLTDPNGRAEDYFGGGGIGLNHHTLAVGTNRAAPQFLGINPSVNLNGRVVVWRISEAP